jgi:hypothetical protein
MKKIYIPLTSIISGVGLGACLGCILGVFLADKFHCDLAPLWGFLGGVVLGGFLGYVTRDHSVDSSPGGDEKIEANGDQNNSGTPMVGM